MRLTLAVLAACVLVASGCSADEEPPAPDPEPTTVTLTADERDDFVARVVDLGFTCRDALPETSTDLACTRPGRYPEARFDTVHVSSSTDGDQVLLVSYCGPEAAVTTAVSQAFFGEVGSPDLLPRPPALEGVTLHSCASTEGGGVRVGPPGARLRRLELPLLRESLRQVDGPARTTRRRTAPCRAGAAAGRWSGASPARSGWWHRARASWPRPPRCSS